jgi:probable selenium-dependent hydroxylase accessory protein YqeC
MFPPPPEYYDHYFPGGPGFAVPPGGGISLAGPLNPETGKLEALPPGLLAAMVPGYDLALLEGDGSRGLPLKGWAGHEPVVPPYTTLSVGVIPISPLGEKVSEALVFRLPQFTRLTGAGEGDRVSAAHLAALITGNGGGRGLFYAARGKKLLFINQVEGAARREEARNLAASLPAGFLAGLEGLIAGSVEGDCLEVLYSRRLLRGAPGPRAAQPPGRKG